MPSGTSSKVELTNKTRGALPRVDFVLLKEAILDPSYELSVALVTPTEARRVTFAAKKKNKASNVLAFPYSKTSGELVLCPSTAARECRSFGMDKQTFIAYLFIHGLLHLKGRLHGATMESEERRIMKRFGLRAYE